MRAKKGRSKSFCWLVIVVCFNLSGAEAFREGADSNWPVYLADKGSTHFSKLKQINRKNVQKLQLAWTYHSGDAREDNLSQIQCNPLIINGVLYGTTPRLKLVAMDATSGRELWRFDPFADLTNASTLGVNRGVVYWAEGDDHRLLYSADHFLYAVNADNGQVIKRFGANG